MVLRPVAYSCRRLNTTTFYIVHDDKYEEHPFIYAKLYDDVLVLFDTGCGRNAAAREDARFQDLKEFLEGFPVADNGNAPLNGMRVSGEGNAKAKRDYLIITTHCHYDHIGGIPSFNYTMRGVTIIASGYDKHFLSPANLPKNSLCDERGLATPRYHITFVDDGEWLKYRGQDLRLQALQTPGHTPDSLAIFDEQEGWLFTGDTFYERRCTLPDGSSFAQAIIFPPQGNFTRFAYSIDRMIRFVNHREAEYRKGEGHRKIVRIGCAHTTEAAPAAKILADIKAYFRKVAVTFEIPIVMREKRMGEVFALWQEPGDPQFSLLAPERLRLEYGG